MIDGQENDLKFLQFPNLKFAGIRHRVFTRHGGISNGRWASLNVGFNTGDPDRHVRQNRAIIKSHLAAEQLQFVHQVHGMTVAEFTADFDWDTYPTPEIKADAMISNKKGVFLCISTADCQPVLVVDPHKMVVANIHSGWRGSIKNVIGITIDKMVSDFDCRHQHLFAGIGPSLGPCCAEFVNFEREIPQVYWRYKNERHHFDFWAISRDQLIDAGVPPKNIAISSRCTRCESDLFFSYRREKQTGRFASAIGLI